MAENDTQTTESTESVDNAEISVADNSQNKGCGSWFYGGKPWEAFKTVALIFSFIVNIIFFIVLLTIAPLILPIVNGIVNPLVSGLNQSFVDMGNAQITREILVDDEIPISFTLPLDTQTSVVVTQGVPLSNVPAQFVLPGGGGYINGLVSLTLPAGLELPVQLSLEVPVDQTIPVQLAVDVQIPLDETELGKPFSDLQAIFGPLNETLSGLPKSNEDLFNRLMTPPDAEEESADQSAEN
ncbi:MAG: hypothetical protein IAF02_06710 [Anaerolineae bacterium]|nr:hypothetical protein [Anaerolineae bacterium]